MITIIITTTLPLYQIFLSNNPQSEVNQAKTAWSF